MNEAKDDDRCNWVMSNDEPYKDAPGVPEPVLCEFCGAKRYYKGFLLGERIVWAPYGPERCTCTGAVAAYEHEQAEKEAR